MILEFKNKLFDTKALSQNDNALFGNLSQTILRPFEFYCQKLPFLTDQEYKVFVADVCGNNLQEITEHSYFSLNYIEFTCIFDFYAENVIIKIVNEINPFEIWYSNPILITELFYSKEIIYKNIQEPYFQRAGVNGYFTRAVQESEVKSYIQETGVKVSGKSTFTEMRKYIFDRIDNYFYRKFNLSLACSIVYLESLRITDKPLLKDSDIIGTQNTFSSELTACVNYEDTFEYNLQIAESLKVINYYPISFNPLAEVDSLISIKLNHDAEEIENSQIQLYKDDLFYANLDLLQIDSNTFEQVFNFTELGSYKIKIPANKYKNSVYGKLQFTELPFFIILGHFNKNHFNSLHFSTN